MDRTKDKPDLSILFISAIRAQLILLLTAIVLLIVFCAVAYSLDDPDTVIIPLSLAALFGSGLAGGIAGCGFPAMAFFPDGYPVWSAHCSSGSCRFCHFPLQHIHSHLCRQRYFFFVCRYPLSLAL